MKKLENKTVFITGGLSVIGKACAIAAAKEGANIVVAGVKSAAVDRAMKEIKKENTKAIFIDCDSSEVDEVQLAIEKTIAIFGTLDVALNNSVYRSKTSKLGKKANQAWLKVIDNNLNGVQQLMQHELTQMAKQKNGVIVNMATIFGDEGYASNSHGILANDSIVESTLTSALAFATSGIRVNVICPGFFDTTSLAKGGITGYAEVRNHISSTTLTKIVDKSEQIIRSFLFLSCADSSFASGNVVEIGGGYIVV